MSDEVMAAAPPTYDGRRPPAVTGGRDLVPTVGVLAFVVAGVAGVVGLLLVVVSFTSWRFGAWLPREQLTTGMVGAAMLGVAPGLLRVNALFMWHEVRSLIWPIAVAVPGLLVVTVSHLGDLAFHHDSNLFSPVTLFSLGWVLVLAGLSALVVVALVAQLAEPALPIDPAELPLPGWTKPLLALLGSALLGTGLGLVAGPRFWGRLVPWRVSTIDAQMLGVWALALGVGVLAALAEDDLARVRPALVAVIGAGTCLLVVLAGHASVVRWHSAGAVAAVVLVGGLLATGVIGTLLRRSAKISA